MTFHCDESLPESVLIERKRVERDDGGCVDLVIVKTYTPSAITTEKLIFMKDVTKRGKSSLVHIWLLSMGNTKVVLSNSNNIFRFFID